MNELIKLSAVKTLELIKNKKISVTEVIDTYIKHIQKINPKINAMAQFDPENALNEARAADETIAKKLPLGKLHGIPVVVKDTMDTKNFVSTMGTLGFKNYKADKDATCIARLRKAGAILIGLTNMPELAVAFETDNLIYGRTNNPYDLSRTPGGSSGGNSALIAAGGALLGVGGDGAGSVRVPSHFCGITGIKPTQGRIPATGLLQPRDGNGLVNLVASFGPMSKYIEDLILGCEVLMGPDNFDSHMIPMPFNSPHAIDVKKLKVAFYTHNGVANATPDTIAAVQKTIKLLQENGIYVSEVTLPDMHKVYHWLWEACFGDCSGGEGLLATLKQIGTYEMSPLLKKYYEDTVKKVRLSAVELMAVLAEMDEFRTKMLQTFRDFDVIISPACATAAKKHGKTFDEILDFTYTMLYNVTGWPAAVVRCDTTAGDLPIGVQIAAKPWREDHALAVALQIEKSFGGWQMPKNIYD
jgi:amidase